MSGKSCITLVAAIASRGSNKRSDDETSCLQRWHDLLLESFRACMQRARRPALSRVNDPIDTNKNQAPNRLNVFGNAGRSKLDVHDVPTITLSSGTKPFSIASALGYTTTLPPDSPLPT